MTEFNWITLGIFVAGATSEVMRRFRFSDVKRFDRWLTGENVVDNIVTLPNPPAQEREAAADEETKRNRFTGIDL